MKIILDEIKKEGILLKDDGTEVSRYSYKGILKDGFTFEELQREIDSFNKTLAMQEEFDNIKELSKYIKIHNW